MSAVVDGALWVGALEVACLKFQVPWLVNAYAWAKVAERRAARRVRVDR